MVEILLLMAALFVAYLFVPATWVAKIASQVKQEAASSINSADTLVVVPEDSVLRRHYITQLRSEIEVDLFPRPTDFTLQRHYDTLVSAELESRLRA